MRTVTGPQNDFKQAGVGNVGEEGGGGHCEITPIVREIAPIVREITPIVREIRPLSVKSRNLQKHIFQR